VHHLPPPHRKDQKYSDAELTICPHCGGPLERTITAPAFQFAGGGWYKDGYGNAKPASGSNDVPSVEAASKETGKDSGGKDSGKIKSSAADVQSSDRAPKPAAAAPAAQRPRRPPSPEPLPLPRVDSAGTPRSSPEAFHNCNWLRYDAVHELSRSLRKLGQQVEQAAMPRRESHLVRNLGWISAGVAARGAGRGGGPRDSPALQVQPPHTV
jgi:predicted nucleic acid-binding Zn ribbon protein